MLKKAILVGFMAVGCLEFFAQSDSTSKETQLTLTGFVDAFYTYDFNQPDGGKRHDFLFNHNRHNEVNLNVAMIKLAVENPRYRGNVAFHAGTYSIDNYAAEPGVLKNLLEANAGIALDKNSKWWIDAGVFPSHLGFESALSIENWTLTRSLVAESSPYFLAGAKITGQVLPWLSATALVCNGWQRIQRLAGSSAPGLGGQLVAEPNDNLLINYSVVVGTDDPDSTRRMRYFHNSFIQWQITKRFGLLAGFDVGTQQFEKNSDFYYTWYGATLLAHFVFNEAWSVAFRGEYFQDPDNVVVPTLLPFYTTGLSLNIDYKPLPQVALRVEGRWFNSRDPIFPEGGDYPYDNFAITGSLAIMFNRAL